MSKRITVRFEIVEKPRWNAARATQYRFETPYLSRKYKGIDSGRTMSPHRP